MEQTTTSYAQESGFHPTGQYRDKVGFKIRGDRFTFGYVGERTPYIYDLDHDVFFEQIGLGDYQHPMTGMVISVNLNDYKCPRFTAYETRPLEPTF